MQDIVNRLVLLILWEALNFRESHLLHIDLVILVSKHLFVVFENFFWKTFEDPGMLKSFEGRHSLDWIPNEASIQEIEEELVVASQNILKLFLIWLPDLTSGIGLQLWCEMFVKENVFPLRKPEHAFRRNTIQFHYVGQLLHFTFAWEKRETSV